MDRRVALVTGASRGIGKACAVALADAGFDVAVMARSVQEGSAHERSTRASQSRIEALPGSLETTAHEVRTFGRLVMVLQADLLDLAAVDAATDRLLDEWGRVDILVNSGRYVGPGHMDRVLETSLVAVERHLAANVLAPLRMVHAVLPGMLERGFGRIVNITSTAAYADPLRPAGDGGWGMCYGVSKGALHRLAGVINTECQGQGILAFNVNPGSVATETQVADLAERGLRHRGAPASVVGAVVAWLVATPEAARFAHVTVEAQFLCREQQLLPTWSGTVTPSSFIPDTSGSNLMALQEQMAKQSPLRGG